MKDNLGDLEGTINWNNVCVVGVPEKEANEIENILKEIIVENFLSLRMELKIQIQKT